MMENSENSITDNSEIKAEEAFPNDQEYDHPIKEADKSEEYSDENRNELQVVQTVEPIDTIEIIHPDDLDDRLILNNDREEFRKNLYYKSNPLRKFVSSKNGQSILPLNKLSRNSFSNKKKGLPKIFSELRISEENQAQIIEDRELHKKGLRTSLKLNLKALEMEKSIVNTLENSKKVYSEYCRYNLTKPLDTSNVESMFKSDFKRFKTRSTRMKKYTPNLTTTTATLQLNNTVSNNDSVSSDENTFRSKKNEDLEINAHTVKLKDLQEMSKEIKQHKANMAKSNYNTIYVKCNETSSSREQTTKQKSNNSVTKHLLASTNETDQHSNLESDESENKINFNRHQSIASTEYNPNMLIPPLPIQAAPINLAINNSNTLDDENTNTYSSFVPMPYYSDVKTADSRYKDRIYNAREKILNEHSEKHNLNKMTILQPFEDTKILINIDNVSSKILNNLLNKQKTFPRYYMPPIRSYGYFKKVTTDIVDDLDRVVSAKRPSAKSRAKFNF